MSEKLYELMDSVRQSAAVAGGVAADVAYAAGKKGSELLSVAKLNIRIVEKKHEVKGKLQELGELLYATHTGTPTESEVLFAKMEEIDALKAEIAALEAALGREKKAACETCGAEVQEGDAFCRACGDQL